MKDDLAIVYIDNTLTALVHPKIIGLWVDFDYVTNIRYQSLLLTLTMLFI